MLVSYGIITLSISDFLWTGLQSENSRIWSHLVFHSQRANQWEYTQAYGMPMIGQHKAGESRRTGPTLPLQHHTGTSTRTLVLCLMVNPLAAQALARAPAIMHGWHNSLTVPVKPGWNGYNRTTWFTITALTFRGSLKAFP